MNRIIQVLVFFSMSALLSGCYDQITYSYLMQHPKILEKKVMQCQASNDLVTSECTLATKAAEAITEILSEQQADPEKFGQKIMQIEENYVKASLAYHAAEASLSHLKNTHPSEDELKSAKEKAMMAQKAMSEADDQMKIYLAVIGLSSPE